MDSREQEKYLVEIVQLTEAMLDDAGRDDWDAVTTKQLQRDDSIKIFFQRPLTLDVEIVAARIRAVLAMDEQILSWGKRYQHGLRRELQIFSRGRNAVKAYAEIKP